jgi:hypothetical protein
MTLAQFFVLMIAWTIAMIAAYAIVVDAWTDPQMAAVGAAVIGLLASLEV